MGTEQQDTDSASTLPLAGLRVIDISNVFSLPYAGGLLSDLGAEVIKIEGPGRVDVTRGGAFSGVYPDNNPADDPWNRTSTFNLLNRGKKSLAIDLRRHEGREVLRDLIKVSDVLMENFTPRVMRGWELGLPAREETQSECDHGVVQRLWSTRAVCAVPGTGNHSGSDAWAGACHRLSRR